jgi:hypothetical protein
MKKRIFIGSSSEEIGTAKIIKSVLENDFEVVIWEDKLWYEDKSVFKLNNNFLHDLEQATLKFDFGIFIGSPDDKLTSRGIEYMTARDNVLFELGLFIGRLGLEKCAFLVSKEVKLPTDFAGIKLSVFDNDNLSEKIDEIKALFLNSKTNSLNFFPSTTLAATYYGNLVRLICEYNVINNGFEFGGKKYKNCSLKIYIPNVLADDLNIQSKRNQNLMGYNNEVFFDSPSRKRSVSVVLDVDENILVLADFPTILEGINYAISNLMPKAYGNNNEDYKLILKRELEKFIETLKVLIKRNDYDDFVSIERI